MLALSDADRDILLAIGNLEAGQKLVRGGVGERDAFHVSEIAEASRQLPNVAQARLVNLERVGLVFQLRASKRCRYGLTAEGRRYRHVAQPKLLYFDGRQPKGVTA